MATIKDLDLPGPSGKLFLVLAKMLQGMGMENGAEKHVQVTWVSGVGEDAQESNPSSPTAIELGRRWKSLQLE